LLRNSTFAWWSVEFADALKQRTRLWQDLAGVTALTPEGAAADFGT
jgi:hypothetical protein